MFLTDSEAVMGWAVKWGAVSVNPLLNIGFPTFKPRKHYVMDAEFIAVRCGGNRDCEQDGQAAVHLRSTAK